MKTLATIITVLCLALPCHAESDKALHLAGSALIAGGIDTLHYNINPRSTWKQRAAVAIPFAVGIGVMKEFMDSRIDPADIAADIVGAALGLSVTEGILFVVTPDSVSVMWRW